MNLLDIVAELRALRTQAGGALYNELTSMAARIEGEARVPPPAPPAPEPVPVAAPEIPAGSAGH
jgi:hypothetical protein